MIVSIPPIPSPRPSSVAVRIDDLMMRFAIGVTTASPI